MIKLEISTFHGKRTVLASQKYDFVPKTAIIAFHGFGQTPESFSNLIKINEEAAKSGINIFYPAGDFRSWFTVFGHRERDVDFINILIKEVQNYYNLIHGKQLKGVHLMGLSDGAYFANYIGVLFNERVASVVSYAGGYMPKALTTDNKYPVLIYQSQKDLLNRPKHSDRISDMYSKAGHKVFYEKTKDRSHMWNPEYNSKILDFIINNG